MPIDTVFEIEALALSKVLEELDYFQILKLEPAASPADIKNAYYRESRLYHPDQFFGTADSEGKRAVEKIYRRINEAYVCLRDDRRRAKYIADIQGPDRAKKLRYTEESEQEQKAAREALLGQSPHARKVFQQGLLALDDGRFAQAVQNFKMALGFEPQNPLFKEKYEEALARSGQKK